MTVTVEGCSSHSHTWLSGNLNPGGSLVSWTEDVESLGLKMLLLCIFSDKTRQLEMFCLLMPEDYTYWFFELNSNSSYLCYHVNNLTYLRKALIIMRWSVLILWYCLNCSRSERSAVSVFVCVCVCEREKWAAELVCVCLCVCVPFTSSNGTVIQKLHNSVIVINHFYDDRR